MTDTRDLKSVVVDGQLSDIVVSETPAGGVRIEVVLGPDEVLAQLPLSVENATKLVAALDAVLTAITQEN
jgi:hypothetical protein